MEKHKVIHERKDCIACGACAAIAPEFWFMDEDGLASLKDAKPVGENFELVITSEEDKATNQEAADVCPVQIIKVEKVEDSEDQP